ncbi:MULTISPECIES: mersacidin family lantibiotic [Bacillus]|nr:MULTISPECIES: mersacidin family lantibiotic [Bacillus cereus group]MBZ3765990.1 mersacidin family lantibiotic [Bacillus cereus]EOO05679.1 type 2 lantibiotic [Bacillus cereus str. Schrouff]EOO81821.1 type 2 lantibiotic [Bacillus cereus K-5975c]MCU4885168.1 mersacidin family lantibiotic [Bacillus cereus]MCU4896413.1 mersacidin family lantibiotic [Bacillus cereus]
MNRNQIIEELAVNHPAGAKLVEVSKEELTRVYGGGDVQPETSPACASAMLYLQGVTVSLGLSRMHC